MSRNFKLGDKEDIMKKLSLLGLLAAVFFSGAVLAEEPINSDMTFELTLERKTEANANTGEFMMTKPILGWDISAGALWDIDKSGEDFLDLNKTKLNFSHSVADNITVYINNDLSTEFERTETTIGTSITF
tara:strand:+ start:7869 stop:8261 length:393 start_codon:yes stop_codon:yes gene_type:complete